LVKVYPNPSTNKLFIQEKTNLQKFQIKILNPVGEIVLISNKKEIDVQGLPNGVYFVNFETDNFISSKKIVIQH
jgi:hypothetical protein